MFQVQIVMKYLKLPGSNNKKLGMVLLSSLFLSFVCYASGWKFFNLLGFNKVLLGLFFLSFGMFLKRLPYNKRVREIGIISLPIWIIAGVICNSKVSMSSVNLGNYWLFILAGITGAFVFFALSKLLECSEGIRKYAKWTIFVVCTHWLCVTFFKDVSSILSFKGSYLFDITSALFVLIVLFIYKPVCVFLNKHIPILFGNYNEKKIEGIENLGKTIEGSTKVLLVCDDTDMGIE